MKSLLITAALSALTGLMSVAGSPAWAQVYRCNNADGVEYINNAKDAQTRGCKTMQGGNVTIIQGTSSAGKGGSQVASVSPGSAGSSGSSSPPAAPVSRVDTGPSQKARDSDSRLILESELKKAEAKLADQQKEYNNGEPEKQGIEGRNYQRYLDRVAEMKSGITRYQSDISSLKRELSRLPSIN